VAVTRLLAGIRELGYAGSANLLVRYLNQGRADALRKPSSPRRLVSWPMTEPADLPAHQHRLADLLTSCPRSECPRRARATVPRLLTGHRREDLNT
jgi:hypothetical protein